MIRCTYCISFEFLWVWPEFVFVLTVNYIDLYNHKAQVFTVSNTHDGMSTETGVLNNCERPKKKERKKKNKTKHPSNSSAVRCDYIRISVTVTITNPPSWYCTDTLPAGFHQNWWNETHETWSVDRRSVNRHAQSTCRRHTWEKKRLKSVNLPASCFNSVGGSHMRRAINAPVHVLLYTTLKHSCEWGNYQHLVLKTLLLLIAALQLKNQCSKKECVEMRHFKSSLGFGSMKMLFH